MSNLGKICDRILVGAMVGFGATYIIASRIDRQNCMQPMIAVAAGLIIGIPTGATVFSIIGLLWDARRDKRP